jgi:hypothetical protein
MGLCTTEKKENRQINVFIRDGVGWPKGWKTVAGRPQGVEGLGMAGPSETLGSPWPHLAICLWSFLTVGNTKFPTKKNKLDIMFKSFKHNKNFLIFMDGFAVKYVSMNE